MKIYDDSDKHAEPTRADRWVERGAALVSVLVFGLLAALLLYR